MIKKVLLISVLILSCLLIFPSCTKQPTEAEGVKYLSYDAFNGSGVVEYRGQLYNITYGGKWIPIVSPDSYKRNDINISGARAFSDITIEEK